MPKIRKTKRVRKTRIWSNDMFLERSMLTNEEVVENLKKSDIRDLEDNLQMSEELFNYLLERIKPRIERKDTLMRCAITPEERLAVTLRFLYSGMDYNKLRLRYKISTQAIASIVPETCFAIFHTLKEDYLPFPKSEQEWLKISDGFKKKWQFENCIGAIACKHIIIQRPPQSVGQFTNHEGTCSIILCGIVNSNYEFVYVHEGVNGSVTDGEIYLRGTKFFDKWLDDELNIPEPKKLEKSSFVCPYGFVGDESFALSENLWTPYPETTLTRKEEIFNYRLNRAHRVVENTFGHISAKFKIFQKPIRIKLDHLDAVLLGCCALHNFLRTHSPDYMTESDIDTENLEHGIVVPGAWNEYRDFVAFEKTKIASTDEPKELRDKMKEYYCNQGRVPFQYKMLNAFKRE